MMKVLAAVTAVLVTLSAAYDAAALPSPYADYMGRYLIEDGRAIEIVDGPCTVAVEGEVVRRLQPTARPGTFTHPDLGELQFVREFDNHIGLAGHGSMYHRRIGGLTEKGARVFGRIGEHATACDTPTSVLLPAQN